LFTGNLRLYGESLWYQWTPPEPGGWYTFDLTSGTAFDSLLIVYTGDQLDHLVTVAGNDNYGTRIQSRVSFAATPGTNYSFVVAGKSEFDPTLAGPFTLRWYPTTPPSFTGTQFSPTSGMPGTTVTLFGTNFTGATSVLFNGTSASFTNALTNNLDLRITAVVPPDAISGPITIVTPHGNVTSTATFQVRPPPLTVRSISTSEYEITWPATGNAFVLEVSETLTAGSWTPVVQVPRVENGQSKLTLVAPVGHRFYRLKTQ